MHPARLVCVDSAAALQGLAAEGILVVSFTTDAAAEFRSRLAAAAGPAAAAVRVATFHSLSLSLLKEFRCAAAPHDCGARLTASPRRCHASPPRPCCR